MFFPSAVKVFVAREPADMRKGHDGLFALVRRLKLDPYQGHLFVFLNRRRNRAKVLFFTKGGFSLLYKRLEKGRFISPTFTADQRRLEVTQSDLAQLLDGVDPFQAPRSKLWEPPMS